MRKSEAQRGEVTCKKLTQQRLGIHRTSSTQLGALRTPTRASTAVTSFRATCEQHSTARKQVTSRPGKRQYPQQNRLDFIARKLQKSRASEGLRRNYHRWAGLSGPRSVWKAGAGSASWKRWDVRWNTGAICWTHGDITKAVKVH